MAERKWACVAISNLIQNDPSTRRLLQGKNVVGALITRLTDSEEEVVVEAVGALRCVSPIFFLKMRHSSLLVEICASMVATIYAPKCTTKISWSPSKLSSLKSIRYTFSFKPVAH